MTRSFFAFLLGTALAAGCSQQVVNPLTPPDPPIVWPKSPDQPRVRYLGQLTGSTDVHPRKDMAQKWDELLHGPTPPSMLVGPHAVAVHPDGQRVAVTDGSLGCVHVFNLAANEYRRESSCGTPLQPFGSPAGVAWVGDALWVADAKTPGVAVLEPGGRSRWIGKDVLKRPAGLAYCAENQLCYVCDAAAHAVVAFDSKGGVAFQFGSHGSGPGQFNFPSHIACGAKGVLAVSDSLNFRVQSFGLDGTPIGSFGRKGDAAGDLALPKGVAVDAAGNIWVVDANFENVQAFTPQGQLLMALGAEGGKPGEFSLPAGVCIDAQSRLWIADTYNRRVQVFELLPS